MKKSHYLLIFLLLTFLVLTKFFVFDKKNDPSLPLLNILKSLKDRDYESFNNNVLEEELLDNSIRFYKNKFNSSDDELYSKIDSFLNKSIINILEKSIYEENSSIIQDYFIGKKNIEYSLIDEKIFNNFFYNLDFDETNIISYSRNKEFLLIFFKIRNSLYNHDFLIKTIFRKNKGEYKLIGIVNILEIINVLDSLEKERKESLINYKNKEMNKIILIKSYYGFRKDLWFKKYPLLNYIPIFKSKHRIEIENISNQVVDSFKLKLTYKNSNGYVIVEKNIEYRKPILPGKTIFINFDSYNPFIEGQVSIGNLPEITYISINLESGTIILNEENQ